MERFILQAHQRSCSHVHLYLAIIIIRIETTDTRLLRDNFELCLVI